MKGPRLVHVVLLASIAGCALPVVRGRSSSTTYLNYASSTTSTGTAAASPTIVQVRAYQRSALVSVLAWDPNEAAFGLSTSVTRNGELVGGQRFGDHRLYLTPLYAHDMGGFKYAAVSPGHLLRRTGALSDPYACFYGGVKKCSPSVSLGVRIPDSLLRANRDSLVVTFYPSIQEPWTITLRPDLIAPYLKMVDSVVAEMKEPD